MTIHDWANYLNIPTSQQFVAGDSFVVLSTGFGFVNGGWSGSTSTAAIVFLADWTHNPPTYNVGYAGTNSTQQGYGIFAPLISGSLTAPTMPLYYQPSSNSYIIVTTALPNPYLKYYWNGSGWSLSFFLTSPVPIIPSPAPCFSLATLAKISELHYDKKFTVIKTPRNNKKMFRADFGELGTLEFTYDHPFIYKSTFCTFEHILDIYPNVTNIELVPNDEITDIYNIVGHTEQYHKDNQFALSNDLIMIGGNNIV